MTKNSNESTRYKNKIEYFKKRTIETLQPIDCQYEPADLIIWHILYKRKIENYIPLNVLLMNISSINQVQEIDLKGKTPDELDFIEYKQNNIGIGESKIKDKFPEMFLLSNFSYRELEERCKHHKVFLLEAKEDVSEIEQILLKIAKII